MQNEEETEEQEGKEEEEDGEEMDEEEEKKCMDQFLVTLNTIDNLSSSFLLMEKAHNSRHIVPTGLNPKTYKLSVQLNYHLSYQMGFIKELS